MPDLLSAAWGTRGPAPGRARSADDASPCDRDSGSVTVGDVKLSTQLMYAGNPREAADQVRALEDAGLDTVWVPEAYGFDSPTLMGYLAAKTERVEIGSAILNIYSRTPSALLQTAAGLDNVSQGRAIIGLGASGPQVIEGFHGVPYDKPLGRTKEIIDLIRRGPAPRDPRARRDLHPAAARGPGHRSRQAAQAAHQARAAEHPALHRGPRPQERRGRRGVRRRLAAVPLRAGEGRPGLGRRARRRHGQAAGGPGPARDLRRRHGRDRRGPRDQGAARLRPARWSRCTSAAWARAARTSTTTWP